MKKRLPYLICILLFNWCAEATPLNSPVICNSEKFEYYKHWNGRCPNGTTWDDKTSCCYGCPQCKPYLCKKIQHEFDKHWNGECPFGTQVDVRRGCCVGCETCPDDTVSLPQADNPNSETLNAVCKDSLNHFHKYWDGQCPSGTKWDEDISCCIGCPNCAPGWMQAPKCIGPCIPCPPWQFSSDLDNNINCSKCTNCAHLNREETKQCTPVSDAVCGRCLDNFQKPKITATSNDICEKVNNFPKITTSSIPQDPYAKSLMENKCTYLEGNVNLLKNGTCSEGTRFNPKSRCCQLCNKCGPGYMQSLDCLSCQSCPAGSHSNHPVNNHECTPCRNCDLLHRTWHTGCKPASDAECGPCLSGYYSHSVNYKTECLLCPGGSQQNCDVKEYKEKDVNDTKNTTNGQEYLPWIVMMFIVMIIVIIVILLCAAAGLVMWKKGFNCGKKKDKVDESATEAEMQSLQDSKDGTEKENNVKHLVSDSTSAVDIG